MRSIEFVGLPGTGKTTIANGVVRFLQGKVSAAILTPDKAALYAAKERCDSSVRRILLLLPETFGQRFFNLLGGRTFWHQELFVNYILENHKLLQAILDNQNFRDLSCKEKKVVFSGLLESGALFECLKRNAKPDWWILFDEGMLQKSMMFVSTHGKNTQESVQQYLSLLELPDVVVQLHVDKEKCVERMMSRPKGLTSRLRAHSPEQTAAFLDNAIEHWKFVSFWLKENTNIPIINMKTDQDLSELIACLGVELEKVIRSDAMSYPPFIGG